MSFGEDPTQGATDPGDDPMQSVETPDTSIDPTQGTEVGATVTPDPTQGMEVGAGPYEDPTQGVEIGESAGEDPTEA